jgi:glyoxylase-like metal-dependent hydrolase (beta-lactamase superfamily II)
LFTPGHSPGGLSISAPAAKSVFTGDALFHYDIGRTDLWGGSDEVLINAIKTKLLTLPEDTVVYPGHGISSIIGKEKAHNPYLKIRQL